MLPIWARCERDRVVRSDGEIGAGREASGARDSGAAIDGG
jgi:hypothetical protein